MAEIQGEIVGEITEKTIGERRDCGQEYRKDYRRDYSRDIQHYFNHLQQNYYEFIDEMKGVYMLRVKTHMGETIYFGMRHTL